MIIPINKAMISMPLTQSSRVGTSLYMIFCENDNG